jgi:hypothetical protein
MAQILIYPMGNAFEIVASNVSLEVSFLAQLHMHAMYQLI